ncbi:MAG: ATP-binding protein [Desulfatiglans sp.]|jgi:two-component system nitrogen regulation sensor histidine kinase NtrY|nr:ATP-binding protein [Desulfatiglans sp.]
MYIILAVFLIIVLLTSLGIGFFDLGFDLPFSSSILVFALINVNVILLLLLLFLIVRNLVKLLFERKRNIMGAKLRTKLVLAFVTLSLLPTIILFFVSAQFISSSIEYWFNLQVEQSLKKSVEVGQEYYDQITEQLLSFGNNLSRVITYEGYMLLSRQEELERFIDDKRKEYSLASLKVFSTKLDPRTHSQDHRVDLSSFEDPNPDILNKTLEKGSDARFIHSSRHGDLIAGIVPVFSRTESKAVVGLVVSTSFVPGSFVNRVKGISRGLQEYRQLKMLKKPIKISHMITLSIVTLLIILSSVWFGLYLSRELTIPIKELADGTNRIASGDYDFFIDREAKDEIGILVNSFNKMTLDLKTSKERLEEANKELVSSNFELEQRRLYMEIVLANVAAGVVSADVEGNVLTINKSAEKMLGIGANEIIGKNYREILSDEYVGIIDDFFGDKSLFKQGSLEREIKVSVPNRKLVLLVSLNVLRDDHGRYLGLVAVFEDLSEIQKAQRMAAWREVARRIAHEVKNPLTPIQLSTQRLKRKYGERLYGKDAKVFNECTEMIIKQVEELKRLVNEFSNFARMPASNPAPADIRDVIIEALALYREAHKAVTFTFYDSKDLPILNIDKEQMRRVMVNLIDNAIQAISNNGEVTIRLDYDKDLHIARIGVADNGNGIPPENRNRLFEPYFSTKKQGTGLGLTIVNTIIADHNGFIRVKDNKPRGTRFVIELPVKV